MFYNVILNDPDGLPCTIKRHLACVKAIAYVIMLSCFPIETLSLLEGDCMCYNAIMLSHTIENT